jgi:hypothetical protein
VIPIDGDIPPLIEITTMETQIAAPRKKRANKLSNDELHSLHDRTRVEQTVETAEAAALIGFRPQSLRKWACTGEGPIQPIRIGRRLRWSVAKLKKLAGETAPADECAA